MWLKPACSGWADSQCLSCFSGCRLILRVTHHSLSLSPAAETGDRGHDKDAVTHRELQCKSLLESPDLSLVILLFVHCNGREF